MPARKAPPPHPTLLLALALVLLCVVPALAESGAAARLRALAEESAANQNATAEEKAATRSLTSLLAADSPNTEATGKAALALSEIALGQGKADSAKNLAEAVLDMVAGSNSGAVSTLAGRAKSLFSAAVSVQQAYAASAAPLASTIPFVDADLFDRKLSDSLGGRPASVEVLFPVSVSMKKLPERLDKWFTAIEKSGGKVETQPVPEPGRGLWGDLLDLAVKLYDLLTARSLYEPAQYYNATVFYKRSSAEVVKVVFSLREQQGR